MKKMLWVMVIIGLLFVGSLPVVAETYTIGMLPDTGWANLQVAEAKGFWEQQGISVKLAHYTIPLELMRTVLQRRVDFIPGPLTGSATFRDAGVFDSVYVGTFSMADYHKYLMLKNDLVNKSLKGQTIGIFNGDFSNTFLLSSYLAMVNTNMADVRLVGMSPDDLEANFRHNRVQVVLAPDRGNAFYEQADGVIVRSPPAATFMNPMGCAFSKKVESPLSHRRISKRFCGGVSTPSNGFAIRPTGTNIRPSSINTYWGNLPDLSDDQFRTFIKEGKFFDPQTLLEHNQHFLREHFTQYRAFLAAGGRDLWSPVKPDVLADFTYDSVIKNQALIEVLQEYVQ